MSFKRGDLLKLESADCLILPPVHTTRYVLNSEVYHNSRYNMRFSIDKSDVSLLTDIFREYGDELTEGNENES